MKKNILIILGHPDSNSFCGALADAYEAGAKAAGHEVERLSLGELVFDPVLHKGYAEIQPLEPDLLRAQQAITTAAHLVFVYPIWWGAPPALLKGFFDRTFLPGYAFRFSDASTTSWDRLLSKRSARLIVTMDTPPWYYRWVYRQPGHNQMKRTILDFCGIRPVTVMDFGPVKSSTLDLRGKWLSEVSALGSKAG
jgi:putative NADPH-quinone reductase